MTEDKPSQKPLRIVSLRVENVKRIRAVRIEPNGSPTVVVAGRNAQGKTSVLDAIEMALGGARAMPKEPIRRGAKRASIVADLGDLVVERVITAGGTTLTVRDADGRQQRSPQHILDALCSRIAFDPLAFAAQTPARQAEILRALLGLDFGDLDAEREALFSERAGINRDAKSARAQAETLEVPAGAPAKPVALADLLAEYTAAQATAAARVDHDRQLGAATAAVEAAEADLAKAEAAAMRARASLKALQRQEPPPDVDLEAIAARMRAAEADNRAAELRARRDRMEERANQLEDEAAALTERIAAVDAEKQRQLAAAHMPIDGLQLDGDTVRFQGVPLDQASGAERLRVSVALGLALHPTLRVLLIRDASLLDDDGLRLVAEMAAEAGAQVWLERVGTDDPTAVVLEDGSIARAAATEVA